MMSLPPFQYEIAGCLCCPFGLKQSEQADAKYSLDGITGLFPADYVNGELLSLSRIQRLCGFEFWSLAQSFLLLHQES